MFSAATLANCSEADHVKRDGSGRSCRRQLCHHYSDGRDESGRRITILAATSTLFRLDYQCPHWPRPPRALPGAKVIMILFSASGYVVVVGGLLK